MRTVLIVLAFASALLAQQPAANAASATSTRGAAEGPDAAQQGEVSVPPIQRQEIAVRQGGEGETILTPRIRSVTRLHNSMPHQLVGIGVVTGLAKTGSSDRGTRQAILNVIRQLGLNLTISDVVGGSTALVSISCSLPPFAKQGQILDVKIEAISDCSSLRGGELLRAELKGVDGQAYVVAQGGLVIPGFSADGNAASLKNNPSLTGWVTNGGVVIREENTKFFSESGALELQVLNPSPFNAMSIANGVTTALEGTSAKVSAIDPSLVRIDLPEADRTNENAIRLLNLVGAMRVQVENPAKVMIDQASGTVLAGEGVLISPCVVGLSDLTITIVEEEQVSQPLPFGHGQTEKVARTRIEAAQTHTELKKMGGGASVSDLLTNLKTLGLTPAQLIQVFQALEQGGFLHATLEVR
ncbi:MAG: flagellar basal body P-ring protein FlgI [Planctomycetes bacterium]|nr:flagellar basal body P-ring protein FlgI [Planctomycetota bacterium]